jgi:hypothetical protein
MVNDHNKGLFSLYKAGHKRRVLEQNHKRLRYQGGRLGWPLVILDEAAAVPDGVGGQAVHVYLHVGPHLLVRQELTGDHLQ